MFTGLISNVGELLSVTGGRMRIRCGYAADSIELGASIACDGCCLTAVKVEKTVSGGSIFDIDVSNETLECTTLGLWREGDDMNLERSLRAGDELGGHIVSGHVDAVARIIDIRQDGDSKRFEFEIPQGFQHYIASKGSVALNGTSLTVNDVTDESFGVNLIPHTMEVTTWGSRKAGDRVNFEVDLLARYVARIQDVMLKKE